MSSIAFGSVGWGSIFGRRRGVVLALLLALFGVALVVLTGLSPVDAQANPFWSQLGADIDGEAADDEFGRSVAISGDGNTVIVGGPRNGDNGVHSGHARVYRLNGTAWTQLGTDLNGDNRSDEFGRSVAISADGNTVIIGAPFNDVNGVNSGHARAFRFNGTDWAQLGADINGEASNDQSAFSLSMSADGNTVIIGTNSNDARVMRFNGTTWAQLGADIDGEASDDFNGFAVAMSADGNTVIIGAPFNDANGSNSGHARIFRFNGTTWTQLGVAIDGEATNNVFGVAVAMSTDGNSVVIGARSSDSIGLNAGTAQVYRFDGSVWVQVGADIDGEAIGDAFGTAVAMSADGNTVIIGAPQNDGTATTAGHARVYRLTVGMWVQLGADLDGEALADASGSAVAISGDGNTVIIGAIDNDGGGINGGHARVYRGLSGAQLCNGRVVTVNLGAGHTPTSGDDVILGTAGADAIVASGGNDTICGQDGNDTINAGPGDDWVDAGAGDDTVFGLDGNDTVFGRSGDDVIVTGNDDDVASGDNGDDVINGGAGNDSLDGGAGNDELFGQSGNCLLYTSPSPRDATLSRMPSSA